MAEVERAISSVKPGALSALLQEIARAPGPGAGGGWEQALRPGLRVGRFELVREIGRGGLGVVWEARDVELPRSVAFKAVRAGGRPEVREERLLREAEAAALLSHPNLVTLFDLGHSEHGPYLVMELLRGETLQARLDREPRLRPREAVAIAAEVAQGVAHAHARGVVHRDLKPANVFLCEDGQVKVLDFGLAHAFGRRRAEGGTPAYMAPEQWQGAPEDERTDVFALGTMLHRMLSGALPFPGAEGARASVRAPALEVAGLPVLGALVARMLEREPVRRPRDGAEVAAALATIRAGLERAPSGLPAAVRVVWRPGLRLAALLALGLLAGAGAVLAGLWWRERAGPAALPAGRVVVAVADFANQTGEPELDALSGLLIASLEESRRLAVLPRGRLFDLARARGHRVTRIDELVGRDAVRGSPATALLVPAVHRFGTLYALELRAVDLRTDAHLFTVREQAAGRESIPELIDRLAAHTRQAFREEPAAGGDPALATRAVAGNLEAYQYVFRGVQLFFADGSLPEAIASLNEALTRDPDLAVAHLWLAVMGDLDAAPGEDAEGHLAAAAAAADRLRPRERGLVTAWQAYHDGRQAEAREQFGRLMADHPEDKEVLLLAAMSAFHGAYRLESEALLVRVLELDPGFTVAAYRLCALLAMQGRHAEAVARAHAAVAATPGTANQLVLAVAQGRAGDLEGALATADAVVSPDLGAHSAAALALAQLGRFEEAEARARPWTRPGLPPAVRWNGLSFLAELVAMQGRRAEALALREERERLIPGRRDDWKTDVQFLGAGGRVDAVRAYLLARNVQDASWAGTFVYFGLGERGAELARGLVPGTLAERTYRANVAWLQGRPAERLALLQEQIGSLPNVATAFWLGEALAASGRCAEAVVEFQRVERLFSSRYTVPWRPAFWAESQVRRARCLLELGRDEAAREALDGFLRAWRRADPDLPLLAEARRLRGNLQAPERARQ